jgi:protein-tyrosine phosphatase
MPIRRHLKAFWWFIEGRVGGMGRPGFNQCHWFDFSLEEGVMFTWLGKQPQTTVPLDRLWQYLHWYGPQVAPFHGLVATEACARLSRLHDRTVLLAVLESMNAKASILQEVAWLGADGHASLRFTPNIQRVQHELELLQQQNVSVVISLLEQPLDHALLDGHFEVYHFPVEDVTPPSYEQVYAFAEVLRTALAAEKNVVTHCLAGVGRTTTMFLAAYLVQGHPWHKLVAWVRARNPHFQFKGRQVTFLQTLADDLAQGRLPLLASRSDTHLCR